MSSGLPGPGPVIEGGNPETPQSQPVMVIIDVQGSRHDKHLIVVRQGLAIKDGQLQLVGPKRVD